ncbi:hypothetical protein B0I21_1075 [Sphingobacterium paludis]|uniref:Uncharacterized protein n=1 Tax=Sphingobacterium paludis TaxID=1476465 RepID=A0A4R7CX54_9SPHI|nr:hypothetical protein B0I21_1075 [Sphingobacterium paludis]
MIRLYFIINLLAESNIEKKIYSNKSNGKYYNKLLGSVD